MVSVNTFLTKTIDMFHKLIYAQDSLIVRNPLWELIIRLQLKIWRVEMISNIELLAWNIGGMLLVVSAVISFLPTALTYREGNLLGPVLTTTCLMAMAAIYIHLGSLVL